MTGSTGDYRIRGGMLMMTWMKRTLQKKTWKKRNRRRRMHVKQKKFQKTRGTQTNPNPSWLIWNFRPTIWNQMLWSQMMPQLHQQNHHRCGQGDHRDHPDPGNPSDRGRH
jgi:hypothetical protein